jgi:hypothetical protein
VRNVLSKISLLLIIAIATSISWQTLTIVHFYSNQSELEEKFCENKEQPELNCQAQCHLNKQLKVQKSDNLNEIPVLEVNTLLVFQMYEEVESIILRHLINAHTSSNQYQFIVKEGSPSSLLDPPELS